MFVDFYQNFSRDATWLANEVVQFYRNIKSTKIKKKIKKKNKKNVVLSIDRIIFLPFCKIAFRHSRI